MDVSAPNRDSECGHCRLVGGGRQPGPVREDTATGREAGRPAGESRQLFGLPHHIGESGITNARAHGGDE